VADVSGYARFRKHLKMIKAGVNVYQFLTSQTCLIALARVYSIKRQQLFPGGRCIAMRQSLIPLAALAILTFVTSSRATELIVNGDFSNLGPGDGSIPGWTRSDSTGPSGSYLPVTTTILAVNAPVGGNPISDPIVICGRADSNSGGNETSALQQDIAIPPNAIPATLTLYYQWRTASSPIALNLEYASGKLGSLELFTEKNIPTPVGGGSIPTPTPGWRKVDKYLDQATMANLAGTTQSLILQAKDDIIPDYNYLLVDSITLDVITATITPTPTITLTPTPTPTATITKTITETATISATATITPTQTQTVTLTPWAAAFGEDYVYPNPASGDEVVFLYSLAQAADIRIDVYNLRGQASARLEDKNKPAGRNLRTSWDISQVAPGIYLYRLTFITGQGRTETRGFKRLVVQK
jgi:hypothetical protein